MTITRLPAMTNEPKLSDESENCDDGFVFGDIDPAPGDSLLSDSNEEVSS